MQTKAGRPPDTQTHEVFVCNGQVNHTPGGSAAWKRSQTMCADHNQRRKRRIERPVFKLVSNTAPAQASAAPRTGTSREHAASPSRRSSSSSSSSDDSGPSGSSEGDPPPAPPSAPHHIARIKVRGEKHLFLAETCEEHQHYVVARGRWDWSHGVNRSKPRYSGPRQISRAWRHVEWIDWALGDEQVAA